MDTLYQINTRTMKEYKTPLLIILIILTIMQWSCDEKDQEITIRTEIGDIILELYNDKAPVTVNNFLHYIKEGRFKEATFYRTVTSKNQPDNDIKIEVIQGGLFEDNHPDMLTPIVHESTDLTGILHKDGIISMARYGPGTATSEFFICIGDQPELDYGGKRNPDGQGFAAFGKVIEGMDVVHEIHRQPESGQYLSPMIRIIEIIRK